MNEKRKPIFSLYTKGSWIKLSAWETDKGDLTWYVKKQVKNKETGEWKEYEGLFHGDLQALSILVRRAIDAEDKHRATKRAEQKINGGGGDASEAPVVFEENDDIPF